VTKAQFLGAVRRLVAQTLRLALLLGIMCGVAFAAFYMGGIVADNEWLLDPPTCVVETEEDDGW